MQYCIVIHYIFKLWVCHIFWLSVVEHELSWLKIFCLVNMSELRFV